MLRKPMLVVLIVTLLGAACGDDDGGDLSSSEEAIVDVLVEEVSADPDPENPFSDEESARCFATGMVRALGVERLAEVGITADSESPEAAFALLDEEEIDTVVDAAFECIDVEQEIAQQFIGQGLSEESAACFASELGKTDFYRMAFIAGMAGDEDFDPANNPEVMGWIFAAMEECLSPEEMADIFGG